LATLRILSACDLERILRMEDVVGVVERAYILYSSGQAGVFPILSKEFEHERNEMDIKAGHLAGAGLYGLKIIGWAADNPVKRNIPALAGLVVVMEIESQQPLGLVEARTVTRLRTGAAGAVGARVLSREDSKVALVVGLGEQGEAQVEGLMNARPGLNRVIACARDPEKTKAYVAKMQKRFPSALFEGIGFEDLAGGCREADIIVTCTPSHKPFLEKSWIRPGTHINAIGADLAGKQELEVELVASARLVGDSRDQVLRQGECQTAFKAGLISAEDVGEIGEILLGLKPGRSSDKEITIFDATGMAIQDILTAELSLAGAAREKLGITVEI
jgi:ornithine cyclodeaminase/alanine dehydrogenase